MDIGDKVRKLKDNLRGKIGIVKTVSLIKRPGNLSDKDKLQRHFIVMAEDCTIFSGFEDEFELVK